MLLRLWHPFGLRQKAKRGHERITIGEPREREYAPAFCIARVYCRIGESEKAIDWLEKAFEERNGEMVFLKGEIEGSADDDPLKFLGRDPRVEAILDRVQTSGRS